MDLIPLARTLRKRSTDAERRIWQHLRGRSLAGYKFRRQEVIEPYIVDFVCFDAKVIVELDGGQHLEQEKLDEERTRYLERMGYRVLRFWNHEVLAETEVVVEKIYSVLIDGAPHPNPLPEGEGVESRLILIPSPSGKRG